MPNRAYKKARRKAKNEAKKKDDEDKFFTPEWEGPRVIEKAVSSKKKSKAAKALKFPKEFKMTAEEAKDLEEAVKNIDMENVLKPSNKKSSSKSKAPVRGAEASSLATLLPIDEQPLPEWHYVPKHGLRPKKQKPKKKDKLEKFFDDCFKSESDVDWEDELKDILDMEQRFKDRNAGRKRARSADRTKYEMLGCDDRLVKSTSKLGRLQTVRKPLPIRENVFSPETYRKTRQLRRHIYHNYDDSCMDYQPLAYNYTMSLPHTVEEMEEYYPANPHLEALLQNLPECDEYIPPEKYTMGMPLNPHFAPYAIQMLAGKPIKHPYKFDREKMLQRDREYRAKLKQKMINKRKEDEEMFKSFGFPHPSFDKHMEVLESLDLVESWLK